MRYLINIIVAFCLLGAGAASATAQQEAKTDFKGIWAATEYPAESVAAGKFVDLPITIHNAGLPPQVVHLDLSKAAKGWQAVLLGGGRPVQSVFVGPDSEAKVTLRLTPDEKTTSGSFAFVLNARSDDGHYELPLEITVGDVVPAKLVMEPELPALRGSATSTFEYALTLTNPGSAEVTASLQADAPPGFQVTFKERYGSQELTSVPIKAGGNREVKLTVNPPRRAEAGDYKVIARAITGDSSAAVPLLLEITGRPELSLTGLGEILSGDARAGEETTIDLDLKNDGSAPAREIQLSSYEPSGWKVAFEPKLIDSLAPGADQKVAALITPSAEAIGGDYQVKLRANAQGASDSTNFRITVRTSTLWGITGILVIAAALGVLTLAIMRYGRR
jgi:uncharacterized membrane protein